MRDFSMASKWFVRCVVAATFAAIPLGCGGEPTGEDGYSQKFEAPPGAEAAPAEAINPYNERRADIEKAQAEPAPSKAKGR